jgi:acetate kinase
VSTVLQKTLIESNIKSGF